MKRLGLLLLVLAALAPPAGAEDSERLRNAKTLFFDRKYADARQAWQGILAGSTGVEAEAAAYWLARCSENLQEDERALKEYGEYLGRRPTDRVLAEEARTSRVGLAARLYKAGRHQHLTILKEALADPSKTVRYYAAFQLAGLSADVGRAAVPVLKTILREEKDPDLVDRAKLLLLRIDPGALAQEARPPAARDRHKGASKPATWVRIRIEKAGTPVVAVNLPVGLAGLIFDSLPDDARRELKLKGYDADDFWSRLKKLGPTEILKIEGDNGERIQIWLE
jgi:hypothetical protein